MGLYWDSDRNRLISACECNTCPDIKWRFLSEFTNGTWVEDECYPTYPPCLEVTYGMPHFKENSCTETTGEVNSSQKKLDQYRKGL